MIWTTPGERTRKQTVSCTRERHSLLTSKKPIPVTAFLAMSLDSGQTSTKSQEGLYKSQPKILTGGSLQWDHNWGKLGAELKLSFCF